MSYVLDGQCDIGSSLPSDECGEVDECICGISYPQHWGDFLTATEFSMGGSRHNIPRYPAYVNVPHRIVRSDYLNN